MKTVVLMMLMEFLLVQGLLHRVAFADDLSRMAFYYLAIAVFKLWRGGKA